MGQPRSPLLEQPLGWSSKNDVFTFQGHNCRLKARTALGMRQVLRSSVGLMMEPWTPQSPDESTAPNQTSITLTAVNRLTSPS